MPDQSNTDLKFQATACNLAKVLYYSAAEAYALPVGLLWEALDAEAKHDFVQRAEAVLLALKPKAPVVSIDESPLFKMAAALSRAEAARVVASITPSKPWGEPADDKREWAV